MEKRYRVRSFRLSDEQIEFLKTLDNPSEWLRRLIDEKMLEMKSSDDRGMALVRRLKKLEKEIAELEEDEDYNAKIKRLITVKRTLEVCSKLREFLSMEKLNLEEIRRYMVKYGISDNLWRKAIDKMLEDSEVLHDICEDRISMRLVEGGRFYDERGFLRERLLLRISMKFYYDEEETFELDSETFGESGLDPLIEKLDGLIKSAEEEKPILEKIISVFNERIKKLQEEKAKLEEELLKI